MVCNGLRFFGLGVRMGLRLLLGSWTRMHDHKAQGGLGHVAFTVLDLSLPDDTLPMPTAARIVLGPPRFFSQEGQGGLLLSPPFQLLAHRTGAWHQGDQAKALF
jgi:hypothetical protein